MVTSIRNENKPKTTKSVARESETFTVIFLRILETSLTILLYYHPIALQDTMSQKRCAL